jgi:hypothetical protein
MTIVDAIIVIIKKTSKALAFLVNSTEKVNTLNILISLYV